MEKSVFDAEKENLEKILKKFSEVIQYYDLRLEAIPKIYKDNPYMLESLLENYTEKLKLMNKNKDKPYFARIDFKREGENEKEKIYIGKVGVMDEDNKTITVDWRAPISSIYYDSNIGKVSYQAPEGVCTGELLVKRQFNIENGILNSYQDVDTVSNDELLKPYLGTSVDNRLKNIVSTIQFEQNAIIREKLSKDLIVQGVAGSGKTTVALHRIAYLVYNNREVIKPDQYLVIGPNKFFVNYISGVLPDLDVNNVIQLTFAEICQECINESFEIINEEEKLIKSISNINDLAYERMKTTIEYKDMLDKFIDDFDRKLIPATGLEIKGYEILPNKLIKEIYYSIENNAIYNSIYKKTERAILLLQKYIEDNYYKIIDDQKKKYYEKIKYVSSKELEEEQKKYNFVEKEIKNGCSTSLKKYFSSRIPKMINIYHDFLIHIEKYSSFDDLECFYEKCKINAINVKNKKVETEDLSALIYLKCRINGVEDYSKYRQVAIDEAQDYGEFCFLALKLLLPKATFSIFGDLAQSIYQYRGIKSWKEVIEKSGFKENCEIKYLLKSYRTTTEIMNSASNITRYIKMKPAEPVIRHGKDVTYIEYKNSNDQIKNIIKTLEQYKENDYVSVAIICKDDKEAEIINLELLKNNIKLKNVVNSETEYEGGRCIITSYLAKGLEFDAVIITNASEERYSSEREIDMKLLYVSMTRPLHELTVLYNNEISKPLQNEITKEKYN